MIRFLNKTKGILAHQTVHAALTVAVCQLVARSIHIAFEGPRHKRLEFLHLGAKCSIALVRKEVGETRASVEEHGHFLVAVTHVDIANILLVVKVLQLNLLHHSLGIPH